VTSDAGAQSASVPPSAATVQSNVQRYYANAHQLTALFRQTVTIATFRTSKVSDGQLCVMKPSDFRFDYMKKQLFFVVDPYDWCVKASIVIDSDGNKNQFNFFTPDLATTITASWFQVNPSSLPTYKLLQLQSTPAAPAPKLRSVRSATSVVPAVP
jgi:outer membrane lipoprotein-sorting protein